MYYAILTNPERRACVVTTGARTLEGAHQQAHEATPSHWPGLGCSLQIVQATSRQQAIEASPEARSWASK